MMTKILSLNCAIFLINLVTSASLKNSISSNYIRYNSAEISKKLQSFLEYDRDKRMEPTLALLLAVNPNFSPKKYPKNIDVESKNLSNNFYGTNRVTHYNQSDQKIGRKLIRALLEKGEVDQVYDLRTKSDQDLIRKKELESKYNELLQALFVVGGERKKLEIHANLKKSNKKNDNYRYSMEEYLEDLSKSQEIASRKNKVFQNSYKQPVSSGKSSQHMLSKNTSKIRSKPKIIQATNAEDIEVLDIKKVKLNIAKLIENELENLYNLECNCQQKIDSIRVDDYVEYDEKDDSQKDVSYYDNSLEESFDLEKHGPELNENIIDIPEMQNVDYDDIMDYYKKKLVKDRVDYKKTSRQAQKVFNKRHNRLLSPQEEKRTFPSLAIKIQQPADSRPHKKLQDNASERIKRHNCRNNTSSTQSQNPTSKNQSAFEDIALQLYENPQKFKIISESADHIGTTNKSGQKEIPLYRQQAKKNNYFVDENKLTETYRNIEQNSKHIFQHFSNDLFFKSNDAESELRKDFPQESLKDVSHESHQALSRKNNYNVNFEQLQKEHSEALLNNNPNNKNSEQEANKGEQKANKSGPVIEQTLEETSSSLDKTIIINKDGLRIPLRLYKEASGTFSLQLDHRYLCRHCLYKTKADDKTTSNSA